MHGLFNYDNPVWRFIGKLGDLMILNLLWVVCSLPVFTIGASTTAMYYVTLKLVRDEDGSTIKGFFHSFTSNFKQSTIIWLILMGCAALAGFDLWFFYTNQFGLPSAVRIVLTAAFGGASLILLFIGIYVFPLQARFYNPIKRTMFNAFFMSVRHLLQTLGIIFTDGVMIAAAVMTLYYAPQFFIICILLGIPFLAFMNSYYFDTVFKRYMPKEEPKQDMGDLSPLLDEENKEVEAAIQNLKRD